MGVVSSLVYFSLLFFNGFVETNFLILILGVTLIFFIFYTKLRISAFFKFMHADVYPVLFATVRCTYSSVKHFFLRLMPAPSYSFNTNNLFLMFCLTAGAPNNGSGYSSVLFFFANTILLISVLLAVAFFTLAERKLLGKVQRREGPAVVGL